MPHVVVLFEHPTVCGGEQSLLALADHLQARGFSLTAAAPPTGSLADELGRRGICHEPLAGRSPDAQPSQAERRQQIARLLSRLKPDLVHANNLAMSRLAGPVARQLGLPVIGHLRDILRPSRRATADLNTCTRLLAVSEATRRWYVQRGLDAAKTFVAVNGVDLSLFRPRPATGWLHRLLKLPERALLLVAIGQINLRKAYDRLLEATCLVLEQTAQVQLVVAGRRFSQKRESVLYEAELKQQAASPPLAGHVHFLGWRNDIPQLLNEATLVVHAARQEPLGRVLLEAAASGVPVVATDVGGTREIFPDDGCGARLVPPDDPAAMAAAVVELLRNPSRLREMAEQGRQRICEAFDARRAAGVLARHYSQTIWSGES